MNSERRCAFPGRSRQLLEQEPVKTAVHSLHCRDAEITIKEEQSNAITKSLAAQIPPSGSPPHGVSALRIALPGCPHIWLSSSSLLLALANDFQCPWHSKSEGERVEMPDALAGPVAGLLAHADMN